MNTQKKFNFLSILFLIVPLASMDSPRRLAQSDDEHCECLRKGALAATGLLCYSTVMGGLMLQRDVIGSQNQDNRIKFFYGSYDWNNCWECFLKIGVIPSGCILSFCGVAEL